MPTTTLLLTNEQTQLLSAIKASCNKYLKSSSFDEDKFRAETAREIFLSTFHRYTSVDDAAADAVKHADALIKALKGT